MGRIALVTGVAEDLGAHVAAALAADPGVETVLGVDTVSPRFDLGPVKFVKLDIRKPLIAKVIAGERVDTVVHAAVSPRRGEAASAKERNVIGTMQLFAACQRTPSVQRLVVKSTAEVYGSSGRDPVMFTEDMTARRAPGRGFAKDMLEVEGYARGLSRRRPDMVVTTIRNASSLGPTVRSPFSDYLRLAAIPKPLGYDARIQVTHHDDLVGCLHHAAVAGVSGTFNLAGAGVMHLSQVIRRLGRPEIPVPAFAMAAAGSSLLSARLIPEGFAPEQIGFLQYGRGLDTTRLRAVLGFAPRFSTEQTIDEFKSTLPAALLQEHPILAAERLLLGGRRG